MRAAPRPAAVTVALCFAAALLEGLDIQAAGVAAPKLVPAFGLSPAQAGRLFSASVVGLLVGAAYGGWLADRVGRKRVLVGSLVVFGACSLATALAWSPGLLVLGRFLTGLGLGGAMPNLIALSAEAGPPRLRTTLVTVMFSGVPLGGAVASAIGAWDGGGLDWRAVFYVGGVGPLLVAPLLAAALPESAAFRAARAGAPGPPAWEALFGGRRAATTLLLWPCFFCTLLVLYLLMNWLPLLLVGKGFGRADALRVSILFNVGGAVGAVALGLLMDRLRPGARRLVMLATYAGVAASLVALARRGRPRARVRRRLRGGRVRDRRAARALRDGAGLLRDAGARHRRGRRGGRGARRLGGGPARRRPAPRRRRERGGGAHRDPPRRRRGRRRRSAARAAADRARAPRAGRRRRAPAPAGPAAPGAGDVVTGGAATGGAVTGGAVTRGG